MSDYVREVKIYSGFRRPDKALFYEKVDKTRITEQAGYIRPEQQIMQFMVAGKRLAEYRRELFDIGFGEKEKNELIDPTRAPGLDLAEASIIENRAKARIRESKLKKLEELEIRKKDEERQKKLEIKDMVE